MTAAGLAHFPGSPFARMAGVLAREWKVAVAEREVPFPPPEWLAARASFGDTAPPPWRGGRAR